MCASESFTSFFLFIYFFYLFKTLVWQAVCVMKRIDNDISVSIIKADFDKFN